MKKILAVLAILLLFAGCSKDPAPVTEEKPVEIPVETVETQTEETVEVPVVTEPEVEEAPVEEAPAGADVPYTSTLVEGLGGDAVGYALELPVFIDLPAADVINEFYVSLTDYLARFSEDDIHEVCLERNCIANVRGFIEDTRLEGDTLTVSYGYEVQYSDQDEASLHIRTDEFNIQTGDVEEMAE